MVSLYHHHHVPVIISLVLVCLFITPCIAQNSFRPKGLVVAVRKDSSTNQYVTYLNQRTPLVPVKLTLDLGGKNLWVDCEEGYVSSSYKSIPCRSHGCGIDACNDVPDNPIAGIATSGEFSAAFSFPRKFALCLTSSDGVVLFGDGPYVLLPGIDISRNLAYTPLIKNPAGRGGTKVSTVSGYSVLESSIYKAVEYGVRVSGVAPFEECYESRSLGYTRVGPAVPTIDLLLHNKDTVWRIFGANSMVQVSDEVTCLGLLDGGVEGRTSIVIGAHQIEDNLLQFDLAASRLGFTSSLLFSSTTCANFNFTSTHSSSTFGIGSILDF
ncbi:basic 7S globulin [Senna tora]|uniref:Basic 7S globulin n=1 Tax=Senna tora TaxID=362788 RepID=A0A835CE31_9FABA|nr:basic 7S globulin [Senna tora]